MQNRNAVCGSGTLPQSLLDQGRAADYRVMVRFQSGAIALVSLARSTRQAIYLAEQFRDQVIAQRATMGRIKRQRQAGIAAIYLETWAGTATEGRWEHFGPRRGGFCHVFRNADRDRKESGRSGLKSGVAIPCVLLAERTRKGGWRAKLVNRELSGPITNWANMPQSARPGQVVELRVGAVSNNGTHIQFHWLPSSGNGRGTKA
ncbi:MAG: hypothetical protein ACLQNE_15995 [Thermoguttaceae bacterium]